MTQQHDDLVRSGLSRRDALKRAGVAAGLGLGGLALPMPSRATQGTGRTVIFVNHDNNPFFVPVRRGLEQFAAMAGWETQFTGPSVGDTVQTVELQRQAIAAQPDAVGFTRIDTTSFEENIREAQTRASSSSCSTPRARGTRTSTSPSSVSTTSRPRRSAATSAPGPPRS
jgi:hypothetical protein